MKPKVFIGSTSEGLRFAESLISNLGDQVDCEPWYQGVFEVGGNLQSSLMQAISEADFVIIVLTADDKTRSRGKSYISPRDNLIFEAGISFGAIHASRTFLVPEYKKDFKLPSDLNGFTVTKPFLSTEEPSTATKFAARQIMSQIRQLGRRQNRELMANADQLARDSVHLIKTASESIVFFGRDLSWASKYAEAIKERTAKGVRVEVFSDIESKKKARANAKILADAGAKIHYCERDPGIKLTIIDHEKENVCSFVISFKERNHALPDGRASTEHFKYKYTVYDANNAHALWLTVKRLYHSLHSESGKKLNGAAKTKGSRKVPEKGKKTTRYKHRF